MLTIALTPGGAAVGVAGIVGLCEIATRPAYHGVYGSVALPSPSPGAIKQQFVYTGHKGATTAQQRAREAFEIGTQLLHPPSLLIIE